MCVCVCVCVGGGACSQLFGQKDNTAFRLEQLLNGWGGGWMGGPRSQPSDRKDNTAFRLEQLLHGLIARVTTISCPQLLRLKGYTAFLPEVAAQLAHAGSPCFEQSRRSSERAGPLAVNWHTI